MQASTESKINVSVSSEQYASRVSREIGKNDFSSQRALCGLGIMTFTLNFPVAIKAHALTANQSHQPRT